MQEIQRVKLHFKRSSDSSVPLYEQIRKYILACISNGTLAAGDTIPRITALCRDWNVNYRTAKIAFELLERDGAIEWEANKGGTISTPRKIIPLNENEISIAYLRFRNDPFTSSLTKGFLRFCEELELNHSIIDAGSSHSKIFNSLSHPGAGINGVVLAPFETQSYAAAIQKAIKNGLKVVFLDRSLDEIDVSVASADHYMAAYTASSRLLEIHGRPAYYFGNTDSPSSCRDRVRGWKEAMREFNFLNTDDYLFGLPMPEDVEATNQELAAIHVYQNALMLFQTREADIYTVFAENDYMARGIYAAAEKMGLRIGEDVFVASCDNQPFALRLPVPLSTVDMNQKMVGYEGAKLLYETITGSIPHAINKIVPVEFIERKSSSPSGTAQFATASA
ncbi:D-ribose-binding periplasmic protein precursor [Limihaloglobus sulfuriphilus]|uniref:D-ribose-binding periplasmic protein n=1 Tax=Limihaloglobus sulfuriphilus TaxID=1851148 RepID=A0A1Q2MB43_9BACT|nr:substrate-binding domain-containing protein [Limihaloglobus sulfuriphilus]AQQ69894.1 D-ribose-binding periplasmic protein precursor [Limihaloglobus sulfuriphilus]